MKVKFWYYLGNNQYRSEIVTLPSNANVEQEYTEWLRQQVNGGWQIVCMPSARIMNPFEELRYYESWLN